MSFLSLFTYFLCIFSAVEAYTITGVQAGINNRTGERPMRTEFSTFVDSGPAFDLYILASQQFQQDDQSELLSYFQVAGIHGYPFISWDGVSGSYNNGYCTHDSILFPPWHRPYMALYEQILWNYATAIANTYPDSQRSTYQQAAVTFRVPYWDWAYTPTMPDAVNQPQITVNTPNGTQTITNPLVAYNFHPVDPTMAPNGDPLIKYNHTVRYPNSAGESQPNLANQQLMANGVQLHTLTYELIAEQNNFAPFSNTGSNHSQSFNSLENMHNAIHGLVGEGGHMSYIPWSSYDPIFWLHHVNVDRLFAIWQAIYPDSYVTPQADPIGTYTNPKKGVEDIDTPLTPFHSSDTGSMHTSNTVRSLKTFGYTYPEIQDWTTTNATELSAAVRTNINNLYNPTGSISVTVPTKRGERIGRKRRRSVNVADALNAPLQWAVNIRVDKFALPTTFSIDLSLTPNTFIGTYTVFNPSFPISPSPNTTSQSTTPQLQARGTLPLTYFLLQQTQPQLQQTLPPSSVLPFLKENLSWTVRLAGSDGEVVDLEEVGGLEVFVVARGVGFDGGDNGEGGYGYGNSSVNDAGRRRADQFPTYGEWVVYGGVTEGMVGGWKGGDDGSGSGDNGDSGEYKEVDEGDDDDECEA
ncbi:MAG: hypothetical protein M1834_001619 [Cirrosporium novae-zelandiae]|nr:MAG: hypothetical protein M1834_004136 [Cirrosporium novae-zelandiae]KAI9735603.1 MAG: hypothetical protein M1834_001619 [Cirrosporium novae-zelandiae]